MSLHFLVCLVRYSVCIYTLSWLLRWSAEWVSTCQRLWETKLPSQSQKLLKKAVQGTPTLPRMHFISFNFGGQVWSFPRLLNTGTIVYGLRHWRLRNPANHKTCPGHDSQPMHTDCASSKMRWCVNIWIIFHNINHCSSVGRNTSNFLWISYSLFLFFIC